MGAHPVLNTLPLDSRRHVILLDAALAIAAFAGSVAFLATGDHPGHDGGETISMATVLLTAVESLPIVARRRAPLAVFALTGCAMIALAAYVTPSGPPLGPTIALYTVALRRDEGSPVQTRLTLALVASVLLAHATVIGISDDRFPGTELLFGTLTWSGIWLLGDRVRLRAERMAALEERALQAEQAAERERRLAATEERMRIARDLHDSAGHAVNVILVHAGAGRLRLEDDPAAAREAFATIEQVARETVDEIDHMVAALREDGSPEGVDPPAGIEALEGLVERHRAAGLDVELRRNGEARPLPAGVGRGVFRIVQEALTNAARHGDGRATVELVVADGAVELRVENPIRADRLVRDGHGLVGMRERALLLGGELETSESDGRFRLVARLPYAGQT